MNVDEIRCAYCTRVHRPAPADAETQAVVQLCRAGPTDRNDAFTITLCNECRALQSEGVLVALYVFPETPLYPADPLAQALAVEPALQDELATLADAPLSALEQAQLYAIANRLMLRQARDLATATAIAKAAQMEAQLVTRIAGDTAARIERGMWWRDNALQAIAARLFPHADAKTKSVRLTYGTLSRKDFKPAPELVDDQAALAACRVSGDFDDCLTVSVDAPLDTFRDALEHVLTAYTTAIIKRADAGETGDPEQRPPLYTVEDALAFLVANETAEVGLAWGKLKKALAQAVDTTGANDGAFPSGVRMTEPRTEYVAKVTEG